MHPCDAPKDWYWAQRLATELRDWSKRRWGRRCVHRHSLHQSNKLLQNPQTGSNYWLQLEGWWNLQILSRGQRWRPTSCSPPSDIRPQLVQKHLCSRASKHFEECHHQYHCAKTPNLSRRWPTGSSCGTRNLVDTIEGYMLDTLSINSHKSKHSMYIPRAGYRKGLRGRFMHGVLDLIRDVYWNASAQEVKNQNTIINWMYM